MALWGKFVLKPWFIVFSEFYGVTISSWPIFCYQHVMEHIVGKKCACPDLIGQLKFAPAHHKVVPPFCTWGTEGFGLKIPNFTV